MPIVPGARVIAFTGPFGSGCSTASELLMLKRDFTNVRLSDIVREDLASKGVASPHRHELQAEGDLLRKTRGRDVLVNRSLEKLNGQTKDIHRIVIDGVRNFGEVLSLREMFGYRFSLVAVVSDAESRWARVQGSYVSDRSDFARDDARDRGGQGGDGQQVGRCVDEADAVIVNDEDVLMKDYRTKILSLSDVLVGEVERRATWDEIVMHQTFSASHSSKCLKRHVGAVIINSRREIIGLGYNENPHGTKPCVEEEQYDNSCFRDIVRNGVFRTLAAQGASCPICASPIPLIVGPPWLCPTCSDEGRITNLQSFYFPDRAMSWCTAIHAEDRALLLANGQLEGATMYTTTFPCFQCAEKIIQRGLKEIVFVEAYPDPYSAQRLSIAEIQVRQFEGVRSSAFERVFHRPMD